MEIIRPGMFFGLIALPLLTSSAISQPGAISWPDAIAQLAGEHVKAKTCVALLKRYGDYAQVARGEITYNKAKADSDAVIAGLITALSTKKTSASLPSLQDKLSSGASGLAEFCNTVDNLLPKPQKTSPSIATPASTPVSKTDSGQTSRGSRTASEKTSPTRSEQTSLVTGMARVAESSLKKLSDSVSALYNNSRTEDASTRRTIQTQLEAAKWPVFSEVKAGQ